MSAGIWPRALASGTVIAALLLGAAAGCGTGDVAGPPAPPESTATAVDDDPHEPMDGVSGAEGHTHGVVVPGAGTDPAGAATLVLTTWARPRLPYETWWAELEPLMGAAGRQAYAETDPAVVPALTMRGAARVLEQTPIWALVAVPTDQGLFKVELGRSAIAAEANGGWQASRIHFPPTAG